MATEKRSTYEIPDNYLPDGFRCIKVFIPDEERYMDQFWSAYEYFASWVAWDRDALKRGRMVALKWRTAFDMARDFFETYGGCEMAVTGIRQNPANECELQLSTDNGVSWLTFADISKCAAGGVGGLSNIHIEQNVIVGTDQCGDTVPLGQVSDPAHSSSYTPPFPEGLPGGRCNAGANAAQFIEDEIHHWADARLTITGIVETIINIVQGLMLWMPETAWTAPVWELFQQTLSWVTGNWEALQTYAMYDTLRVFLARFYDDYGQMSKDQWTTMIDEMKTRYTIPATTDSDRAWFIATWVASNLGSVGMARVATSNGILDASCEDVEWSHTFDLKTGLQGWVISYGQWVQGTGVRSLLDFVAGNGFRRVTITRPTDGYEITGVKMTYFCDLGSNSNVEETRYAGIWHDTENPAALDASDEPPLEGENEIVWDATGVTQALLGVTVRAGFNGEGSSTDPGGLGIIQSITINGVGNNPFA